MVTITLHCPHCESDALVRNGHASNGKHLSRCHACGRQSRENPTPHAYPASRREEMLHAYQERSSLRGLTRTFGVSRTTVSRWIKKRSSASSFPSNLGRPRPSRSRLHDAGTGRTDGSFVFKKAPDFWMGMALCRKRRQVVAYAVGDRSKKTGLRLWEAIPSAYRRGHCFTDFWATYAAVIPEEQHTSGGKETGETAQVERWTNTLRQRLARFVRMTLSFSKSVVMHEACLLLFLHRYN